MSTIVISKWTTTPAYRADPTIADEGLKIISDSEGVIANYHGFVVEDPEIGVSVQVCTSPEAFMKVVTDEEKYNAIKDKLEATRVGEPQHWHCVCVSDPLNALGGPYQEVSRFTLRNDTPEAKATLDEACANQNKFTEGKMTYGWCIGDPKSVLVLYSWESPEAHAEMAATPEVAEILKKLNEIVDMNGGPFQHAKLIRVK